MRNHEFLTLTQEFISYLDVIFEGKKYPCEKKFISDKRSTNLSYGNIYFPYHVPYLTNNSFLALLDI